LPDESLADRLHRDGALTLDDVLRFVPPLCDALVRLSDAGVLSTVTVSTVRLVDGAPVLTPEPLQGTSHEQVKTIAALTYALLKGLPPPTQPSSQDFIGLQPEVVRPVHAALLGTGASDVLTFARQLRALGSGGTAQYDKPMVSDTKVSSKVQPAASPGRVGQIFGAYELVRRLGEGGMGEVSVGRHTRLGRKVAVKVLREEFAARPDVVHRFFQEAKVVNDLKHPNTAEILDFVEEPGRISLVMELLEDRTVAELDREQGPLRRVGANGLSEADRFARCRTPCARPHQPHRDVRWKRTQAEFARDWDDAGPLRGMPFVSARRRRCVVPARAQFDLCAREQGGRGHHHHRCASGHRPDPAVVGLDAPGAHRRWGTPNGAFLTSPWGTIVEPTNDGGVRGLGGDRPGASAARDTWRQVELRLVPGMSRFSARWDGQSISTPMVRFPPFGWNAFGGAFLVGGTGFDFIDFWVSDVTVSQP
jgi:hypothetical protein